jgi:clan AA aspartic protease (TIGR02281 family)
LGRLLVVPGLANDTEQLWLLVDTGASITAIARHTAQRLGLNLRRPLRRVEATTADGVSRVPIVSLQRLQIGQTTIDNLEVAVINLPSDAGVDGVLGMNFYDQAGIKRVTLELDTETLVLWKPAQRKSKRKT